MVDAESLDGLFRSTYRSQVLGIAGSIGRWGINDASDKKKRAGKYHVEHISVVNDPQISSMR